MTISTQDPVNVLESPELAPTKARVIPNRARQSVHQIRDRVWKAKIRQVERIEDEEDRMWGIIAERIANDPDEVAVPYDVVRREFGLDQAEQ